MKKKLIYTLLTLGILLSTSSCNIIDFDVAENILNAFTFARAVNFIVNNSAGIMCVGIITAGFAFLKSGKHKQFRLWLSRAIAFFVVMSTIIMSLLFYIQYHEFFRDLLP